MRKCIFTALAAQTQAMTLSAHLTPAKLVCISNDGMSFANPAAARKREIADSIFFSMSCGFLLLL